MIFFDGLLYRLSLKTAVRLRVHLQYYPHHMMPINRIPFLSGTKENVFISIWLLLLAFGCTLSFNRRCLQKFLHHLQSSFIIIFYILKQTQILVFIHIFLKICYFRDVYWRFTKMYSPLSSCHRIIVMSSNHRHHLLHTLKQTQYFVFIHIQQYVILEVFCRITFR